MSAAQNGALPVLALAVVPALLAARGVLRPVRGLRQAAGRIAEGKLETRLEVKGSDELADLSRTFNDMAAKLEESVADLRRMEANARRFAADVSHELRTPLAAMSAVTDVLDEDADALDPDTASAVRLISQETGKLARMVEDLMEVSRFDAGPRRCTWTRWTSPRRSARRSRPAPGRTGWVPNCRTAYGRGWTRGGWTSWWPTWSATRCTTAGSRYGCCCGRRNRATGGW